MAEAPRHEQGAAMTWNGLTAGGNKAAAAEAHQQAFDKAQAAARAKNSQQTVDYSAPAAPATPPRGDGRFDGGFATGACICGWKRDGVLRLARRADGSIIQGDQCPTCGLRLYE